MRDATRQVSPTRVALLELKDERRLVEEGYELLDEKRMLIAAEIRRSLDEHRRLQRAVDARLDAARAALAGALRRHGLDELQCLPAHVCSDLELSLTRRPFLGIELIAAALQSDRCQASRAPVIDSPEYRRTAAAHAEALGSIAALAASEVSLRRLIDEYVRTERRARALESVLLPEIRQALRLVEDQLESLDQEEAVRARHHGTRPTGGAPRDRNRPA